MGLIGSENAGSADMSTRSSLWLGEDKGISVHIYRELAEREIERGRMVAAPVYISVDKGGSNTEVAVRLPKEIAEALLTVLSPTHDGLRVS
jgi:hypothetical protein